MFTGVSDRASRRWSSAPSRRSRSGSSTRPTARSCRASCRRWPARRRHPRRPHRRDHRRPGADGRQLPVDRRDRHRRQRDAARAVQPDRQAAHRLVQCLLVQRAVRSRRVARSPSRRAAAKRTENVIYASPAACARGARAWDGQRHRPDGARRRHQGAGRRRDQGAGLHGRRLAPADIRRPRASTRTSRSASTPRRSSTIFLYNQPSKVKIDRLNLTYEGLVPRIQKSTCPRTSSHATAHPRLRRARGHVHGLPRLQGHPAQRGARGRRRSKASTSPTRARCRSATWRMAARRQRAGRRAVAGDARQTLDSFVEIGLGYLSLDRPSGTLSAARRSAPR